MVEPKPDPNPSIAAAALREMLAKVEAKYRRERDQLERAIRREEGQERLYSTMSNTDAIEWYLKDNPGVHKLKNVVDELKKFNVTFAEGTGRKGSPHSVAISLVKQHHNPPRFVYDEGSDLISLAEPDENGPPTPKRRTKGRRR